MYEWDEAKRAINLAKHNIDFSEMTDFDWDHALVATDPRHEEPRYVALGPIRARLHVIVFTRRHDKIRIISLRKANPREQRRYKDVRG